MSKNFTPPGTYIAGSKKVKVVVRVRVAPLPQV
jgi:hypothetical protein